MAKPTRRRRARRGTATAAGIAAGAAAVGGAVAAVRRRWSAGPGRDRAASARDAAPAGEPEYTCACGARYRVAGAGRHLVVWPAGASEQEPVLGDRCPSCGVALPGASTVAADDAA